MSGNSIIFLSPAIDAAAATTEPLTILIVIMSGEKISSQYGFFQY